VSTQIHSGGLPITYVPDPSKADGVNTLATTNTLLQATYTQAGTVAGSALTEAYFSGSIPPALDAVFSIPLHSANGIGFYVVVPTNGAVAFEGSRDGAIWDAVTLREQGAHGYSAYTGETGNWIGSCSTLNYLRWRTIAAGSEAGSVIGKLTYQQNTLEGIEQGNMPHRIGAHPIAIVETIGSICTNQVLYTPSSAHHRLVITDIFLNSDGNTTATLTESGVYPVFRVQLRPANGAPWANVSYCLPVPFNGTGTSLCFTNSATQSVDINVHAYEAED